MDFIDVKLPSKPAKIELRGPTGAGKTFIGLTLAQTFAGDKPYAFLDSESGRGMLFARMFNFKYASLSGSYPPQKYVEAINSAVKAGMGALLLDSLTQAWNGVGGVLDQVNASSGNKFTDGWGKIGTPLQNQFTNAIISAPIPLVCTVRTKMGYEITTNESGKKVPLQIGLQPEQRDGLSYEFDYIIDISMDHVGTITKMPPMGLMDNQIPADGYVDFAQKIIDWMATGEMQPQTWADIKAKTGVEGHLYEYARQLNKDGKTVKEAWALITAEMAEVAP